MLRVARFANGQPEVFASIQGEGISAGRPSIFVRLSLCNLRCSWCDTKYTWDWEHYEPRDLILQIAEADLLAHIRDLAVGNVVVTGGEPLLQQEGLAQLVAGVAQLGRTTEVETNGTLVPSADVARFVSQWNVSPKLANSANTADQRERAAALDWFAQCEHAWFKFVVQDPEDVEEVAALEARYSIPRSRILLMPEGTSSAILGQRSSWLAPLCTERGYRFTTRLHVLLWGDERGR